MYIYVRHSTFILTSVAFVFSPSDNPDSILFICSSLHVYLSAFTQTTHSLTHSPTHSHDIPSISHIPDHLTPTQLLLLQFASSFFLLSFSSQAKQTNFSHIFFISLSCFWVGIIGHRCAFLLPNVPFLLVFVCLFAFIRLPFEKFIIIYFHYFLDNSQTKIHLSLYKYVI